MEMRPFQKDSEAPKAKIDLLLAKVCSNCPVCRRGRQKQEGAAYCFTSKVEGWVCPFCQAYERVYGRKAHEPLYKAAAKVPASPSSTDR